jgi:prephenate dehydrogenase
VTIVGFGAFGAFIAGHLAPLLRVSVFDPAVPSVIKREGGARLTAGGDMILCCLTDLAQIDSEIIILAVPPQRMESVLRQIAPHLRAGQIVIDVCSIKEDPARLMEAILPPCVDIVGTHPMFGPQSARDGVAGHQIVLCPVRGDGWRRVAWFLRRCLKLRTVVTSPHDHDQQAAMTQGLTHLLARAFLELGEAPKIRTRSYDLLSEALAMVACDAPEVFDAITRGNRHVFALRERFTAALNAPPRLG